MTSMKLQTLSEIFNKKIFRIPDYQRGYSWGDEQLTDFWDDIENLKEGKEHYTGLLTVEKVNKEQICKIEKWQDDLWLIEKRNFSAYYLIDGQQRLTTSIILIKVILDKFKPDEGVNLEQKSFWEKEFLYQSFDTYKSFIFGYEKDNPSDEFFKTKILDQTSISSNTVAEKTIYTNNLLNCKNFFEEKLKKMSKEDAEKILSKITGHFRFNFYEIDEELDVFVTFETMNFRGKSLSKLELLKNRLIYLSTMLEIEQEEKLRLRKDINDAWKTIYEYLGKNMDKALSDDEFLFNHWIMYFEFSKGESEVYSKFLLNEYFTARNVLSGKVKLKDIKDYVESISKGVKDWFFMFNTSSERFEDNTCEWFRKLDRLDYGSFAPLVMASLVKNEPEQKLKNLLAACERFIFLISHVTKRQSNTSSNHFYRLAHEYYTDNVSILEVIDNINWQADDKPDENDRVGWFDSEKFVNHIHDLYKKNDGFYSWSGLRYFLFEYEQNECLNAKGEKKIHWDKLEKMTLQNSIEHIYPQTANKNGWKESFQCSNKAKKIYLNSLGNLLLLSQSKNSELQNEEFVFKKRHQDKSGNYVGYFNGSYSEIEVAQNNNWTPKEIVDRGIKMLIFLEKRWNIKFKVDYKEILKLEDI